jgi:hypothetical protein
MAKLEIPVRAFVEDLVKRTFPNRDWSRGSAINDLVIKSFGVIMQPFRHEVDVTKINQSMANWKYMRPEDLDALATNWGKYRQRGGKSIGTVRMYFDAAQDCQFNSLTFFSTDGSNFILSAPVTITATELFQRRLSDGTFYFDVTVESVGIGSRYALPAGSIVGVTNRPPGVVRVENPNDFAVTAPDESNFDVVNSMYKNIGLRNLVSRQSIRAPLLDTFPGIVDLFIAGAGHPNMLRDLADVVLSTGPASIHLGGMTDVWLNTTALSKQQVSLSYLPSSKEIQIVSADQAQANELIFAFTRGLLTLDGVFANPDATVIELDESASIVFDVQDVPVNTFVLDQITDNLVQLGERDIVSGQEMVTMIGRTGFSPYVADLTGINLGNTDVAVDDYILIDDVFRRISAKSGFVLDLAPRTIEVQEFLYSGADLPPGTRTFALPDIQDTARINDRLVIPTSAASGFYNVVGIDTDEITIAKVAASGTVTYVGVDPELADTLVFEYNDPNGDRPLLPFDVGTSHYLYFGTDAGYDQSKYFPIVAIEPGIGTTIIKILDGSSASLSEGDDVVVIAGLTGTLPQGSIVSIQRDDGALRAQGNAQTFDTGHTLYANVTDIDLDIGVDSIHSIGIGAVAGIGDLIEFSDVDLSEADEAISGGDGSRFSVVITAVTSLDEVEFSPPLPAAILKNSRFIVARNELELATVAVTGVNPGAKSFSVASVPDGLGDGIGMVVVDADDNVYVVTNSTAGDVRTLQFKAPVLARTVTMSAVGYVPAVPGDKGRPVFQDNGGTIYNGVLYDYDNATRVWLVIPNGGGDTFSSTTDPVVIVGSTATGTPSAPASGTASYGYTPADPADIGKIVRQGTYMGILDSYDNGVYTWDVKPIDTNDLFDSITDEVFVDTGVGTGTLEEPASELVLGSGAATFVLDETPAFAALDNVRFFSRFGRSLGMFDGENFTISADTAINPTPFTGIVPNQHKLAILIGDGVGLYDISRVDGNKLRVTGAPTPSFIRIPNAPAEKQFVLGAPLSVGTTTISQTGIGRWAYPGRVLKITTPSGPRLFVVDSINNADSVEIESPGLPFAIYPTSGFSWEIVEALNIPYWLVDSTSALKTYRVFRAPKIGDLVQAGVKGSFTNGVGLEDTFTDNTVDFSLLLANADFTNGDFVLYIDSGSEASSTPITILDVPSTNTLQVDAEFTTIETGLTYRIVQLNKSTDKEDWIEATVVANTPKNVLELDVPADFDFTRFGSYEGWVVNIHPHPAWEPGMGWSYGANWTMPKFTVAGFNTSTNRVTLTMDADTYTLTAGEAFDATDGMELDVGDKVRISLRAADRAAASQLGGSAVNTFNYYADTYFQLPIVKITDVQLLDSSSLQPIRSVAFSLRVDDAGLRYSNRETNTLVVNDDDAILQPLRVTYVTDSIVASVNNYLNTDDTRVLNCNQLAKRMETFSVSVSVRVRSTLAQAEIASIVASYINSRRSTVKLTKADIIKDLFDRPEISYIDLASFTLSGVYYTANGTTLTYTNVDELYGSDTSCYLADNISITKL